LAAQGAERGAAGTSLSGTSTPLPAWLALLEGSATQPRVRLAARKASAPASQLDLREAGADGT